MLNIILQIACIVLHTEDVEVELILILKTIMRRVLGVLLCYLSTTTADFAKSTSPASTDFTRNDAARASEFRGLQELRTHSYSTQISTNFSFTPTQENLTHEQQRSKSRFIFPETVGNAASPSWHSTHCYRIFCHRLVRTLHT